MANIDHYLHASLEDARASLLSLLHRDPGEAATIALDILLALRSVDAHYQRRHIAATILSKAAISLGAENQSPQNIALPSGVTEIRHPVCNNSFK